MANLWSRLRAALRGQDAQRFDLTDLDSRFRYGGNTYAPIGVSAHTRVEDIENSFAQYVQNGYKANGVVFATILSRMLLFTEARFQWQQINKGRPGDLFGNQDLAILETPWPNGTTGELLARMEQDVSLAGNFYAVREGDRLRRLRPDWVTIVLSAPPAQAIESDVIGYQYHPGGVGADSGTLITYLPDEVVHWSPIPDPDAQYRGMSWLTPVIREIQADTSATEHKLRFFHNGAKPGLVISMKETVTQEQFRDFIAATNDAHQGVDNAYKTLYVGGGADVTVAGADLRQLDFKATQGAGETRITAAGGVPAVIVGLSEGLQAATYSNYSQARRKFGDHWARPQWRSACAALQTVLNMPTGTVRLWYDDRDIAFLREDQLDAAQILKENMLAIESGIRGGYVPDSVVAAVTSGDLTLLKHTGLFSVQLQPPGSQQPAEPDQAAPTDQAGPPADPPAEVPR